MLGLTLFCSAAYAQQEIMEPEFIGEALLFMSDNVTVPLDKETVQIKTKAGASVYIVGVGKIKTKINIDGASAKARVNPLDDFQLIVKAVDNNTDPMAVISIFTFDTSNKTRKAEIASAGTFSGNSSNNMNMVGFTAKKYGNSSYLITLKSKNPGEYGIITKNPNSLDEKNLIVSCFGIDQQEDSQ